MEKFETSSLASKFIAGLLGLIILIGSIAAASITGRLERIESYSDTLAVHRMQIQALSEMKQDIRDIKTELRELNAKVH